MSYILEALKKSDAERKRGEVPTLDVNPALTPIPPSGRGGGLAWILAGVFGVLVVSIGAVWILRPDLMQRHLTPAGDTPQAAALQPAPVTKPVTEPVTGLAPEPKPSVEEAVVEPEPTIEEAMAEPVAESADEPEPQPLTEPESIAEPEPHTDSMIEPEPELEPGPNPVTIYTPTPLAEPPDETAPAPASSQRVSEPEAEPTPEPMAEQAVAKPAPKPVVQKPKPQNIAKSYVDKAWASIDKGLYNQAMRDLDRAVKLEPAYADAWFARGWTHEKSGKELSAIGDYGRAINAQPNHAFALFSRAYLNLYVADPRDAVTDFLRTQGVAQDQSLKLYSQLWLYLSRMRTGENANARLHADLAGEKLDVWPAPLVQHYLGYLDEAGVIAAIDSESTPPSQAERRCTGYFFLGVKALEDGDKQRARTYFEKTLATGGVQFRQYDAAKRELDRLNF